MKSRENEEEIVAYINEGVSSSKPAQQKKLSNHAHSNTIPDDAELEYDSRRKMYYYTDPPSCAPMKNNRYSFWLKAGAAIGIVASGIILYNKMKL